MRAPLTPTAVCTMLRKGHGAEQLQRSFTCGQHARRSKVPHLCASQASHCKIARMSQFLLCARQQCLQGNARGSACEAACNLRPLNALLHARTIITAFCKACLTLFCAVGQLSSAVTHRSGCACRTVMSKLADALEGGSKGWAGAAYVRIEGSTDPRDRLAAAAKFRNDPNIRVALLSVTAAGGLCTFSGAFLTGSPVDAGQHRFEAPV